MKGKAAANDADQTEHWHRAPVRLKKVTDAEYDAANAATA
jgi:hypothetical protein